MTTSLIERAAAHLMRDWLDSPEVKTSTAVSAGNSLASLLMSGLHAVVPSGIDVDAILRVREVFGVPAGLSDDSAVEYMAAILAKGFPADIRNVRLALNRQTTKGRPPVFTPPRPTPRGRKATFVDDGSTAARILSESLVGSAIIPPPDPQPAPRQWTADVLFKEFGLWRLRLEVLESVCETDLGRAAIGVFRKRLDFEQVDVPRRQGMATQMAEGFRGMMFRGSTIALGQMVHRELQWRYLSSRWFSTVVSEWWVVLWEDGYRQLPRLITAHAKAVYLKTQGRDRTYDCVQVARVTPFWESIHYLLWDLADISLAEIWEIKPVGSASDGVVQEAYYRLFYEFIALHWLCFKGFDLTLGRLKSGGPDFPFEDPYTGDPVIHSMFSAALPFTCEALPGMVLYVVLRNYDANVDEAVRAIDAVAEAVDAARQFVKRLLDEIDIYKWIVVLLFVLLLVCILLWLFSSPQPPSPPSRRPVPGPTPAPPPGQGMPGPWPSPPPRDPLFPGAGLLHLTTASRDGFLISLDRGVSGHPEGSPPAETETTVLRFGHVAIEGIPRSLASSILPRIADMLDAATAAIGHSGRTAPPPTMDVS